MTVVRDNPRQLAVEIIERVFKQRSYADILLEKALSASTMPPKDRALTTELVYGTLRWQKKLTFIVRRQYRGDWQKMPKTVQWILITGLYQLIFLDRTPDYAVVSQAVSLAKGCNSRGTWGRVVNGVLRRLAQSESARQLPKIKDKSERLALKWSHPQWLIQRWTHHWGDEKTEALCRENNKRPSFGLRVNPMRSSPEELYTLLKAIEIETQPSRLLPEMLIAKKAAGLTDSEYFRKGYFSIQDESAALVGLLVDGQRDEKILDMASAPGGKTFHMAERARGALDIFCGDLHVNRLKLLLSTRNRLGFSRIFPILCDGAAPSVSDVFDKVLLDAPCSGLGVLKRRAELRWHRTPEDVDRIVRLQKILIHSAAQCVKAGGALIYSTCTILPEENENVVDDFLRKHPEFSVEHAGTWLPATVVTEWGAMRTWPDVHHMDGAFAVRLKKQN